MIQPLNSSITAKFVPLQTVITPDFRLSPQKIDTFIKCYEILANRENQLILCEIVSEREQKRARSYNYSFTPVPLRVSLSCMHENTPKRCQETLIDTFLRFSPPVIRFHHQNFRVAKNGGWGSSDFQRRTPSGHAVWHRGGSHYIFVLFFFPNYDLRPEIYYDKKPTPFLPASLRTTANDRMDRVGGVWLSVRGST